jgi:pyrimidine oxygenase
MVDSTGGTRDLVQPCSRRRKHPTASDPAFLLFLLKKVTWKYASIQIGVMMGGSEEVRLFPDWTIRARIHIFAFLSARKIIRRLTASLTISNSHHIDSIHSYLVVKSDQIMTMDIGVFIPIGNNGWLISENAPQYKPSFELNKQIVLKAEKYGLDFALSMIKLRGFGGKTEFWDHNLESFTMMAGIAAVTSKIKLFASTAILTLPPALVARMASTIDNIAPGRFGVNIVTGWQPAEYTQMGVWPGNEYFGYRYEYASEYVQIMRDLWSTGVSNFKGKHFQMEDCKLSPQPSGDVKIVAAGQSAKGMAFASELADYNFVMGSGVNTPTAYAKQNSALVEAAKNTGRDVGAYVLFMIIAYDTDEEAEEKWTSYKDGADKGALQWIFGQTSQDKNADNSSTAKSISLPDGAVNMNMGTLVGSYEKIAGMLDDAGTIEGTKGIMMVFDDFLVGLEKFGTKIQPLMKSRSSKVNGVNGANGTKGSNKKRRLETED